MTSFDRSGWLGLMTTAPREPLLALAGVAGVVPASVPAHEGQPVSEIGTGMLRRRAA